MWQARTSGDDEIVHLRLEKNGQPASYQTVLEGLRNDADFRGLFNAQLAAVPFAAFRWETSSVNAATLSNREFECVVVNDPNLECPADARTFAKFFRSHAKNDVATFPNLSGDAVLVVPCPQAKLTYPHLATFVRQAPEIQQHALWQQVAEAMFCELPKRTVWLNTAGAGVAWLHVRLDSRPKYYWYRPYKQPPM
jgi:hypothetical protein